jgi:hypothetical protein
MALASRMSQQQDHRRTVLSELRKQQQAVERLTSQQRGLGTIGEGGRGGRGSRGGRGGRAGRCANREPEAASRGGRGGRRGGGRAGGRGVGRPSGVAMGGDVQASMQHCMPMMSMGGPVTAEYIGGPGDYMPGEYMGGAADGGYVCGYAHPQMSLYGDMGGAMGEYGEYMPQARYARMNISPAMVMGQLLHSPAPNYAAPAGMQASAAELSVTHARGAGAQRSRGSRAPPREPRSAASPSAPILRANRHYSPPELARLLSFAKSSCVSRP